MTTQSPFQLRVAQFLQREIREGSSNIELAERLGFDKPNMISMLISPKYANMSPLAAARLPRFCKEMGLNARETLELILLRAKHHGNGKSGYTEEFIRFVIQTAKIASIEEDLDKCLSS